MRYVTNTVIAAKPEQLVEDRQRRRISRRPLGRCGAPIWIDIAPAVCQKMGHIVEEDSISKTSVVGINVDVGNPQYPQPNGSHHHR
jgi:hypothetical protein